MYEEEQAYLAMYEEEEAYTHRGGGVYASSSSYIASIRYV